MGPSAGLDGRKISPPPGFDPGPSSPQSVTLPTELPGSQCEVLFNNNNNNNNNNDNNNNKTRVYGIQILFHVELFGMNGKHLEWVSATVPKVCSTDPQGSATGSRGNIFVMATFKYTYFLK